jgi:polysaccharide pyruvyl transferase WcaK-like protein
MHIVVPFGFYGYGNTGDEATLSGFARLLTQISPKPFVSVCSRNPAHTANVEPGLDYFGCSRIDRRRWAAKATASAHVFAGGTPIQDVLGDWPLCEIAPLVRQTLWWKVPIAFVGVGVESLASEPARMTLSREIAPRVRYWSVRSSKDRERLMAAGVSSDNITVAADMAWLLEPVSDVFGQGLLEQLGVDRSRVLVAVNILNENSLFDRQPAIVQSLATALDSLIRELDARVVFIAQEVRQDPAFDTAAATRVIRHMSCPDQVVLVPNEYFSPRQLMSIIGCCRLSISMRYHFCLMSAIQGVPFIAIERTDKLADLCWDLEWRASLPRMDVTTDALVWHARRLVHNAESLSGELRNRSELMRARAWKNDVAIDALRIQPQRSQW